LKPRDSSTQHEHITNPESKVADMGVEEWNQGFLT
jgi:hypothetical protein